MEKIEYVKVQNKINHEEYFVSKIPLEKEIDGIIYIGVKRNVNEKGFKFVRKDSIKYVYK